MGRPLTEVADKISWYCVVLLGIMLVLNFCESTSSTAGSGDEMEQLDVFGLTRRACDEIYMVGEGETLQSISEKCGDPYIVEFNPHIHDPDDVFPGLVIKITPHFITNL